VGLVDVDGLRGLDLSADSSGPHRVVKGEAWKVKGWGRDEVGQRVAEHGLSYRLTGIRSLMEEIDLAVGDRAGKRSGKFVVADRLQPWVVREEVDHGKLGDLRGWFDGKRLVGGDIWEGRSCGGDEARGLGSLACFAWNLAGTGAGGTMARGGSR
jgi:hypothetical protein